MAILILDGSKDRSMRGASPASRVSRSTPSPSVSPSSVISQIATGETSRSSSAVGRPDVTDPSRGPPAAFRAPVREVRGPPPACSTQHPGAPGDCVRDPASSRGGGSAGTRGRPVRYTPTGSCRKPSDSRERLTPRPTSPSLAAIHGHCPCHRLLGQHGHCPCPLVGYQGVTAADCPPDRPPRVSGPTVTRHEPGSSRQMPDASGVGVSALR